MARSRLSRRFRVGITTAAAGTGPGYPGPSGPKRPHPALDRVLVSGDCHVRHACGIADSGDVGGASLPQRPGLAPIAEQLDQRLHPAIQVVEADEPPGDTILNYIAERPDVGDDH